MGGRAAEIDTPPPHLFSVPVLDVPVFGHRLMVMAALAQSLPVLFVPEQVRVAAMRLDMIHDRCRDEPSFLFASDTPWMTIQKELPGFLPTSVVTSAFSILPFSLAFPSVFLTVFFAVRHKPWAAWILARRLWSSWHSYHLRHQKRTDGF